MEVYKQNLIILRDFLIDNKEFVEQHLGMEHYVSIEYTSIGLDCDMGLETKCSLIGWCAHIPGLKEQIADLGNFGEISKTLFGIADGSGPNQYLFGPHNTDSVESAIKRLTKVIDE